MPADPRNSIAAGAAARPCAVNPSASGFPPCAGSIVYALTPVSDRRLRRPGRFADEGLAVTRDGGSTQRAPAGHARRQLADRLVLARAQQARGDLNAALDTLRQIIDAGRGLDGATVLTARRMLAEIHLDLGHTGYAHELAGALFADCTGRLGPAHPATIRSGALLA